MQSLDDIGVIVLDTPVAGVEPATIAPLGTLDGLPRGTLFTLAGYGIHYVKPTEGPRKPTAVSSLERSWTTSPLSNLTSDTLMLAASPQDTSAVAARSALVTQAAPPSTRASSSP